MTLTIGMSVVLAHPVARGIYGHSKFIRNGSRGILISGDNGIVTVDFNGVKSTMFVSLFNKVCTPTKRVVLNKPEGYYEF